MNNKRWRSLRILNNGRSAQCEEKKSVSVMEHAFYQGNVGRLFADFLTFHSNNSYLVIYIYIYDFSGFVLPALKFQQDRLSSHVL